jgi:hypothetical protein
MEAAQIRERIAQFDVVDKVDGDAAVADPFSVD